ncbi:hypothetical protein LLH23_03055 [bacterium]|nr:hypothetical protein [bacterium]
MSVLLRRARIATLPLLLLVVGAAFGQEAFPTAGEWPCYRGGPTLQARSRLKGTITAPQVIWKQYTGALKTHFVVEPGTGDSTLQIPDPKVPTAILDTSDPRWGLAWPEGEIGGKRQQIRRTMHVTYADTHPDVPGLEKIEFESGFSKPTIGNQWQPCMARCFGWQDGAWAKLWETEPINMLFEAAPVVGDLDGDGKLEIAFLPWYDLVILNAATGAIKHRCTFTKQRSYGYLGVWNLDGYGSPELLVQADFCKHVDVLGFRSGQLKLLWQWNIEPDISHPRKVLRAYPHPVADVDGDRKPEIVLSVYNGSGDQRWHVTIHEPTSGVAKADLPGECLDGLFDLDGDGVSELLTSVTTGASPPPYGTIRVRSLRGGQPIALWEATDSAWVTWEPPLPPNANSAAIEPYRDALCRPAPGGAWVAVRQAAGGDPGQAQLLVGRWRQGGFVFGTRVSGPRVEALALSPDGALLAVGTTRPNQTAPIAISSGQGRAVNAQCEWGAKGTPVVTRPAGEARPTIVVQGQDEELVAVYPPEGGEPAVERWRTDGRGQSTGWLAEDRGPVLADLRGDGQRQVIYATASPGGGARLMVASLDLQEVWHHDFPSIPGSAPVRDTGGMILWQVAHLSDPRTLDVVVTVRRSFHGSEETYGLSGLDGHELWHRDSQVSERGVGGTPFALADLDGDGLDDVASFYPSLVYILKGTTGQDLVAQDATWEGVPAKPVYNGLPLAGDFEGTGRSSLFFATENRAMTGLVRADGSLVWWDACEAGPQSLQAIGDFDGDGKLEAMGYGYADGVRCYDTASGKVEWRLPAPMAGIPAGSASGDLNSDGRDEALFTIGSTLLCLGTVAGGASGAVLWPLDLPGPVGPPAIADLEGRGQASVLLLGRDRYIYCVR